jgi:hypothetical protein
MSAMPASGGYGYSGSNAGYLQLTNYGQLFLQIDTLYAYSSVAWSCSSSYSSYGYDVNGNIVYLTASCAYDYTASYDYRYCSTLSISDLYPTMYPTMIYNIHSSKSVYVSSTLLIYVIPAIVVFIALCGLYLKTRCRSMYSSDGTVVPYDNNKYTNDDGDNIDYGPPVQQYQMPAVQSTMPAVYYPATSTPSYVNINMSLPPSSQLPFPSTSSLPITGSSQVLYGSPNIPIMSNTIASPTYVQPFHTNTMTHEGYQYQTVAIANTVVDDSHIVEL